MLNILAYPLSVIYWIFYMILIGIFHPIQVVCNYIGGDLLRKKSVDLLNFFLLLNHKVVGASNHYKGFENAPKNKPLIFVSNHQSMFDIPPIIWGFREFHPKFVSKKELGKGVPSISMNLRLNNSALIDRKDPKQSIEAVEKLGRHIEKENYSACIFPEGTRGRNGKVKDFKVGGLEALLRGSPSALIIPIAINGTSKLISKGYFPLTLGCKLNYTALSAIDPKGRNIIELTEDIRQQIIKEVEA